MSRTSLTLTFLAIVWLLIVACGNRLPAESQNLGQTPSPESTPTQSSDHVTTGPSGKPPTTTQSPLQVTSPRPKNVVLFIADGAGTSHVDAARYLRGGVDGNLELDRLDGSALVRTEPLGGGITDSAAAATAMATGNSAANGVISVDPTGQSIPTLFELAKSEHNMAVGAVVTSSITHATPAAFYAHVDDRNQQNEIAFQAVEAGLDVLLGGGLRHYLPSEQPNESGAPFDCSSQRRDRTDLLEIASDDGFDIVFDSGSLAQADSMPLLGLFACSNMSFEADRDLTTEPSLSQMTAKAISLLESHEDGFLLVVEGSRIDHAAARNDGENTLRDLLEFDQALGVALDFAALREDTVVLATSDHETGGLELIPGDSVPDGWEQGTQGFFSDDTAERFSIRWRTNKHTADTVFLRYPRNYVDELPAIVANTDIYGLVARQLALPDAPPIVPTDLPVTGPDSNLQPVQQRQVPDCSSSVEPILSAHESLSEVSADVVRIGLTGHSNIWWGGTTRTGENNVSRIATVTRFMYDQEVDAAIWLGDDLHICQPAEIDAFSTALGVAPVPIIKVLGNHDLDDFHGELVTEGQLARFNDLFGHPPYHFVDTPSFRLLFLADESAQGASFVSEEQLDFLLESLRTSELPVVVFAHHVIPVRETENLNAMIGAGSNNAAAIVRDVLASRKIVLWVWNQHHSDGRLPVQRQGVIEYTPGFVTAYVGGEFKESLTASIVTLKPRRILIDEFDVKTGDHLQQFQFSVDRDNLDIE